ncbi:tyrosine-type recombinase/integrase [Neobacillus sedimentimangrovi]|uniref:tyrosine-type recombinase/integrase n=1 Tax=Neobacillus sedimentimangrovi TaxID=2699460 RepID=UPI0013D282CE
MKGHYYKPHCKCVDAKGESKRTKKCSCGAKWAYIIDIGTDPKTGKRKQKKKGGFNTKTEAQEAAALLIAELTQGTYVEEKNVTFEQFAYEWLEIYKTSGKPKKPGTIRIRKHEIQRLSDYFAKIKLKDITRQKYQDALNDLKKRGFAENTLDGAHRTGRMIFKKAVEMELIKKDPTEFAYVPKDVKSVEELEKREEIPNYLEKEELALFLKTAKEKGLERDYPIFMLLAYTGMRVGELCALKWKDIDFEEGTISITKTTYNPSNNIKKYQLVPPKTKTAIRKIDVDPSVIAILEKHKAEQNKVIMKYRKTYHNEDFVFAKMDEAKPEYLGYPELIKTIENRMRRLLKLSGLNQELTPHSLRHTHTSLLAEAGVGLEQIMERLGHKDDDTTKHVYLHMTKEMKKEASRKFARLMENL